MRTREVKMQRILKFAGIMIGLIIIPVLGLYISKHAFGNQSYELNRMS